MSRFPIITAKQLVKVLKKKGFQEDRWKGSHLILIHSGKDITVSVPMHSNRTLGKGITLAILKDTDISREEFLKLLK